MRPAEALFNTLAQALADDIAAVACSAPVDPGLAPLAGLGQVAVDGDVRGDPAGAGNHRPGRIYRKC